MVLNPKLIIQDEYNGKRVYYRRNSKKKKRPSVSELISRYEDRSGLEKWKEKVGEEEAARIIQEASKRGVAIHRANEGKLVDLTAKEAKIQDKFQTFIDFSTVIESERRILWESHMNIYGNIGKDIDSREVGFGGTFDCLALVPKNKLVDSFNIPIGREPSFMIVDWKTKRKLPQQQYLVKYFLQASAYAAALNVNTDKKYKCNEAIIAVATTRSLALYYLSPAEIHWYWSNFKELIRCYFFDLEFDWNTFKSNSIEYINSETFESKSFLGERVFIDK